MSSTLASGSFRAGAGRPPSARRILVVDDDRPSREGLGVALMREGHVVETAGDAWEAIVRLRAQPFDIAVVDLDLPAVHGVEFGGWDVVRIARAYQAGIAVIVLSADEDAVPAAETHSLVAEVLAKPISLRDLTALVDALRVPESTPGPSPPTGR
jgi:two-component system, OmpR family, response regulator